MQDLSRYVHPYYRVDFGNDAYDDGDTEAKNAELQDRRASCVLDGANCVSSETILDDVHTIMLDVDHPVRVVDSTTPGHHHLYIDVALPWPKYLALLEALAEAGVVEPGYVAASKRRGATFLRLPWVAKTAEDLERAAARKALDAEPAPTEVEASPGVFF